MLNLGWNPKHITKESLINNIIYLIKNKYDNN